jgi:hypothetical protein
MIADTADIAPTAHQRCAYPQLRNEPAQEI